MNNKGFTLIELLVVIAIIVLLLLIIAPTIFRLIDRNNKNSCNGFLESIESSATMYAKEDKYSLNLDCSNNTVDVSLRSLYESGYLEGKVVDDSYFRNPIKQNRNFMLSDTVTITYTCSTKTFTYKYNFDNICD